MTTLLVAYEIADTTIVKIQELLAEASFHDADWGGANFVIERDEMTCFPNDSSIAAHILLGEIERVIRTCETGMTY